MNYTKGEWILEILDEKQYPKGDGDYGLKISIQTPDHKNGICYLTDKWISSPKGSEMLANAQLIAAAPDMFEVLNDIEMTMGMTLADHFPELRNKIVKALAKAEGKI